DGNALAATSPKTLALQASRDAGPAARDLASIPSVPATAVSPDASSNATLALLHVGALAHSAANVEPTAQRELTATIGTAAWNDELGTHLTFMAQQGSQSASLQVTPPDLGPIEVRIAVHD